MSDPIRTSYMPKEKTTTGSGPMLASRFTSYLAGTIRNMLCNPDQINDDQLKAILWKNDDTASGMAASQIDVSVAWPRNYRNADKLPAIRVFNTSIAFSQFGMDSLAQTRERLEGTRTSLQMTFDVGINIRTQSYALTNRLAELVALYLLAYQKPIAAETALAQFNVLSCNMAQVFTGQQDSQDVYSATILCKAVEAADSIRDTVGPTLKAIHIVES